MVVITTLRVGVFKFLRKNLDLAAQIITFLKLQCKIKQQNVFSRVELTPRTESTFACSHKGDLTNINDCQKIGL